MVLPRLPVPYCPGVDSVDRRQRENFRVGPAVTRWLPALDRNGRIVVASRAIRSFAFGLNSVALGLYLAALGLTGEQIGLVLSAALAGTMVLTIFIAGWGDRIGRRRLLIGGSLLMTSAALIPIVASEPLLIGALALSGMVAVTSNESSGLQTVDQALLPQSVLKITYDLLLFRSFDAQPAPEERLRDDGPETEIAAL